MSRQILAIEVRNDIIAGVLLNTGLKSSVVTNCIHLPVADQSENGDGLTEALALLLKKINPTTTDVVISIPPENALFRFLKMPFKEDAKIRQILPFELEPALPIGVEGLKIDYQKNVHGDRTEVLAAAMDRSIFEDFMDKFSAADIRPQLVVPGGFPLAGQILAAETQPGATAFFIDVGNEKATLFALRSGRIELVRCLPADLADESGAESLSLRIRQTLTAWSDNVSEEIVPTVVYASGPGLENPDHLQNLTQALEMNVQPVDASQWFSRVEVPPVVAWTPNLMNDALALSVLEAEGIPCLNFHRISSPLRNYWSNYKSFVLGPAILMVAVIVIALAGVLMQNYFLKKQVKALDAQMEQIFKSTFPGTPLRARPVDQMQSELSELKKGGSGSEQSAVQTRSIDVLLTISQSIPDNIDVVLSRMTIGANEVSISGETKDFNSVDEIKSRLEKNDHFKEITIASANMNKSGSKVLFKLKIDL